MTCTVAPGRDRLYYDKEEIAHSRSKKGRKDKESYYAEDGKSLGTYAGLGTIRMGLLDEPVNQGDLVKLTDGMHPKTMQQLWKERKKNKNAKKPTVVFTDSTISAPKCVSLIMHFDRDNKEFLENAWDKACKRAMAKMQEQSYRRLNSKNEKAFDVELIQMCFDHKTARPIEGKAPDPQIHRHILTLRKCFDNTGKVRTIDSYPLYNNQKLYGALANAEMAHALRECGYEITKTKEIIYDEKGKHYITSFGVKGITQEMIDAFSSRTLQINEVAQAKGKLTSIDKNNIAQSIKRNKEQWNEEDLFKAWGTTAGKVGLTAKHLDSIKTYKKDELINTFKLDEEIIRSAQYNGKLFESKLILRLAEYEQYTGIPAEKYFKHLEDKGIIKREKGFLFSHTLKLEKTEYMRKSVALKQKSNRAGLLEKIESFTKNFSNFSTMYETLNMSTWQFNDKKKAQWAM